MAKGLFGKLAAGLAKTKTQIVSGIDEVFNGVQEIDDDFFDNLEEVLIMSDLGINATTAIVEALRNRVEEDGIRDARKCRKLLVSSIKRQMKVTDEDFAFEKKKSVILVVGVNGVGKTTTVGKLAAQYKHRGKKIMIAAADTFRAAAVDQLREWAKRADVDFISQQEGSDPAAVVFDAVSAAKARGTDLLLVDTAGRLHNKKNLMQELSKIKRVIEKEYPEAHLETLVVLDGTTGQNALMQAREFKEVTDVTGIVVTKLDGTAKGGIAIAIQKELGIPIKYIGIGEQIDDLQRFDPDEFVDALFDQD